MFDGRVCILAVTEESAPVSVTVLVTETLFVVNVTVATPATPPPVRVTIAWPLEASEPEHDWLVQLLTPVPALRTPRFVLTVRAPPAIGAPRLASSQVAVMLPDVPVEVTDIALVGSTEPDAARPGATAVGAVKVRVPAPAIRA